MCLHELHILQKVKHSEIAHKNEQISTIMNMDYTSHDVMMSDDKDEKFQQIHTKCKFNYYIQVKSECYEGKVTEGSADTHQIQTITSQELNNSQ